MEVVAYDNEGIRYVRFKGSEEECLSYCLDLDPFSLGEWSSMAIINTQTGEVVKCIIPY